MRIYSNIYIAIRAHPILSLHFSILTEQAVTATDSLSRPIGHSSVASLMSTHVLGEVSGINFAMDPVQLVFSARDPNGLQVPHRWDESV
jgi:hypothetical protein